MSHGKRFYVVHGDRWDTIIYRHRRATEFLIWIYNSLMRINGSTIRKASRWMKRSAKLLTRNCAAIQFGAVAFARKKQIDAIFCGHTHLASLGFVDEILYGNDGTWQSDDPHFIGIKGTEVHLCKYTGQAQKIITAKTLS
jgi:UDP-2,3-diacylglucosamine pyrophosphatase LpxH